MSTIIVAGSLYLAAEDRDRYLAQAASVAVAARAFAGCLDFVQAADPIDPSRINVYERWESDQDLHRFRTSGGPELDLPAIRSAEVAKYRISAIEEP